MVFVDNPIFMTIFIQAKGTLKQNKCSYGKNNKRSDLLKIKHAARIKYYIIDVACLVCNEI